MIGLKEIRDFIMTLPGVEEGPPVKAARRIAAFKVAGKSFLGVETGEATMTINLGQERAMTSEHPEADEEIWRNREIFMGLRVQLSKVPARRVRELIKESWRDTAPNRVIAV
jgi:predicted DNA-binding protein (MmcQ/YjbR family)